MPPAHMPHIRCKYISLPNYTDNFVAHIKLFINLFKFIIIFISGHLFKFHCWSTQFHADALSQNLFQTKFSFYTCHEIIICQMANASTWLERKKVIKCFFFAGKTASYFHLNVHQHACSHWHDPSECYARVTNSTKKKNGPRLEN